VGEIVLPPERKGRLRQLEKRARSSGCPREEKVERPLLLELLCEKEPRNGGKADLPVARKGPESHQPTIRAKNASSAEATRRKRGGARRETFRLGRRTENVKV